MTDTTVADAAPNEVVIEPTPVTLPNPVGSQQPEGPAEYGENKHRPESRREALERAFERATNPPPKNAKPAEKPAPKAAEAKVGHNNPPEKTEKVEPLDLRKRPADQPRGERGQFAPRQQDDQVRTGTGGTGAQPAKPVRQLPEGAPFRDPPARMAEHAKRDWDTAPESVRGEFHRMAKEAGDIYRQYRGDYEAMEPIRHFQKMATEHGTTLEHALTNYVSMEQKLRSDVVGGLDIIVNNLNLRTPQGQKLTLRDVAYHILNMSPDQHRLTAAQNAQTATSHQIGALHQEISGLKSALHQMHTAQQFTHTRSAVDQFADAHPRFDELGDLIENELKFGFDLETAYRRAELLRPTTHAAQTRTPSAQTRPTDKSISGAPDVAPSNGASKKPEKKVGRREAIQHAIDRVGGSF